MTNDRIWSDLHHAWERIDDGIRKVRAALAQAALKEPEASSPASAAPTLVWGYSLDEHPETWSGHCASREEAIAEGNRELHAQLQGFDGGLLTEFWIMSGLAPDPATAMPAVDSVIDQMNAFARDNWGEVAEEFPDVTPGARKELAEAMATWARKNAQPRCWVASGIAERIKVT